MKFKSYNLQFIKNYFGKTTLYSIPRYILELTLVIYILKLLTVFVWLPIEGILYLILGYIPELGQNAPDDIEIYDPFILFTFVGIAPFFETFTGQWIPIWIASFYTRKIIAKILFSSIIFAAFHVQPFLIVNIFPAGVILAWTFVIFRRKSKRLAFFVTSAVHMLHNAVALVLQMLI